MEELRGRLGDLVRRLDHLPELTLTKLVDAIRQAELCVADVARYVRETPQHYHRGTVIRRDNYELLVLTWTPGQGSVPHDHAGSISAMQVLHGNAIEGTWRTAFDGYVDLDFETPLGASEMTAWQDAGVHTVRNSADSSTTLITVHVYAPPRKDFRRYVPRPTRVGTRPLCELEAPTIVVVGGGFSGAMTAAQILRRSHASASPIRVALIERQGAVGDGLAYATRDPAHLLNVPAARMSAWPDRPNDFVEWAAHRYGAVAPAEFLPRQWYGEYVRETLTKLAHETRVSFKVIFDEVRRLVRRPEGGWMVSLARGASLAADSVVLAIGHRPPPDPIGRLWSGPRERFISDPWRPFAVNRIAADEPVVILGSGLTAVDAVLTLSQEIRKAPITLISRRGLVPQAHAQVPAPSIDVGSLVNEALLAPDKMRARTLSRLIRRKARHATTTGGDWRSVIDALRPHTATLWRAMPVSERRNFLVHLRPYWEVHRHRMAPNVASSFHALLDCNAVRIIAGTIASAQADNDEVRLHVRHRGELKFSELPASWVINCTGPAASNSAESNPVIGSLLVNGSVYADELFMGLETTSEGKAIDGLGNVAQDLFIVGTLRKPQLWESTAVPELREQAESIASQIIQST
jgi:uncharacterized NAD(P)/FAD-binding protein YdhS